MSVYRYVSNRTCLSKAGKETGRVKVAVKTGSDLLEGEYTCPECLSSGKVRQAFKRPLAVRCEQCKVLIKLPKLK
ncbi:MAG: hypothetical protein HY369_05505 [Candidatus Aenigmarchaeota archaeon]|nr:hypothetical protein [Candidatus Aenigmarchaeota archaeon]